MKKFSLRKLKPSKPQDVIVVSGLPRSGTSLMMKMLNAGGIDALTDGIRMADTDNPGGYYELESAKKLSSGDTSWMANSPGKAVKVIAMLLSYLPDTHHYRVIFMRREMSEILASQRTMLINRGEDPDSIPDAEMARLYDGHLNRVMPWLVEQPNFSVLYVDYNELMRTGGERHVDKINSFLGGELDTDAMRAVIDPALYRQREGA